MRRTVVLILAGVVVTSACQSAPSAAPAEPTPAARQPAAPPPNASYIPAGTVLTVKLNEELSARAARVGDTFTVATENALVAENGDTVIRAGAVITGLVTGVGSAGEQAAIRLNFTRIAIDNASHPFTATINATQLADARSGGVTRGAVIGEGELRTALIRGPLGAGAGTIISLGAGTDRTLPAGTTLTIQTVDRITLENR